MGEDSVSIIRKLYGSIQKKDLDAIEALVTDDFELIDCASGQKFNGPEGARKNASGWLTAFPDVEIEMLNAFGSGDWAVAEAVGRGTHSGPMETPMGEVPPTGKKMALHFCSIVKVRDGKIVEERDYYDVMTIVNQLSLMPEPATA